MKERAKTTPVKNGELEEIKKRLDHNPIKLVTVTDDERAKEESR